MTKQHLVAFASQINARFNLSYNPTHQERIEADAAIGIVCCIAAQFNPRFDEARFRAACFAK